MFGCGALRAHNIVRPLYLKILDLPLRFTHPGLRFWRPQTWLFLYNSRLDLSSFAGQWARKFLLKKLNHELKKRKLRRKKKIKMFVQECRSQCYCIHMIHLWLAHYFGVISLHCRVLIFISSDLQQANSYALLFHCSVQLEKQGRTYRIFMGRTRLCAYMSTPWTRPGEGGGGLRLSRAIWSVFFLSILIQFESKRSQ